jgi:hypothetical protein
MTSLDPKIIMREKGIETAKPIQPGFVVQGYAIADLLSQARSRVIPIIKEEFAAEPARA